MPENIELDNVSFMTIDTIGPPGKRVFHLQAKQDDDLVTVTIEKFQAAAIADSLEELLRQIEEEFNIKTGEVSSGDYDFELMEPVLPLFRVGQIGMGYSSEEDRVFLIIAEAMPQDAPEEPRMVRFAASRERMKALIEHAREVVAGGRPICGNCGEPIDPDGHFCPDSNGHRKPVPWA